MLGHGAGSNLSRRLGASDIASARRYASTSFFLSLICGSLIMALGLIFCDPLMRLLRHDPALRPNLRQIYPDRCACTRSGIIFVPVILILSHSFGLFGIEISQSLADILSAAVTIPFFLSFFRTLPKEDE